MVGKYRHNVDPKGRLFVPAKLREELGDAFYVTLGLDHCLSVYTEAGWQAITEKYNALPLAQARMLVYAEIPAYLSWDDQAEWTLKMTVKGETLEYNLQ